MNAGTAQSLSLPPRLRHAPHGQAALLPRGHQRRQDGLRLAYAGGADRSTRSIVPAGLAPFAGPVIDIDRLGFFEHADCIVKRWEEYTGKKAILAGDGRGFSDMAEWRKKRAA